MKVRLCETAEDAAALVANETIAFVNNADSPVIGLATGRTQLAVYNKLCEAQRAGSVSFRRVRSFNLDEYVGLAPSSPYSFAFYMREHFVTKTDILSDNVHLINGAAPDPHLEAERYDALIVKSGGIDLQLLSVGMNGHIGFNEPGSNFKCRTHVERLTAETIKANRSDLPVPPPDSAITQGIGTILEARALLMLATGSAKAPAVRNFLEGPIDQLCPASALRLHRNALAVLDRAAASELKLGAGYCEG